MSSLASNGKSRLNKVQVTYFPFSISKLLERNDDGEDDDDDDDSGCGCGCGCGGSGGDGAGDSKRVL